MRPRATFCVVMEYRKGRHRHIYFARGRCESACVELLRDVWAIAKLNCQHHVSTDTFIFPSVQA